MKKIDVDAVKPASEAAGVECMPTFKVYKGGVESDEMQGADENGLV